MIYVDVPRDFSKIKSKVLLNLTARQLACFGGGALIGVPLFFLLRKPLGPSTAVMIMMFAMLPAFLLAMYEKNGQPLEVVLRNMVQVIFKRPKQRPYKTRNLYAALERQYKLDQEVYQIVHGKKNRKSKKAVKGGKKANRGRGRKGKRKR